VILSAIVLALLPTQAQEGPWTKYQQGPQKLIVAWAQGGVTVIDYPTWDRCQRASEAVEQEAVKRRDLARERALPGAIVTGSPWTVYAFCIPG
jgi:hypothetical protein